MTGYFYNKNETEWFELEIVTAEKGFIGEIENKKYIVIDVDKETVILKEI